MVCMRMVIALHDIDLALVLERQAQRQRHALERGEMAVERAETFWVARNLIEQDRGRGAVACSVSIWVMLPISVSQLAPLTQSSSPIFFHGMDSSIQANASEIAVFAVGELNHPPTIVAAMRAGAGEFLERDATSEALIEAFTRFTASRSKGRTSSGRARIFTVMNSKGGAGGTTVAVNTAIALQETVGGVLLVDFAPLGHCALHLNVRPTFGVVDALQNLHRLDASLLEGLMTQCKGGLQLLAGPQQPQGVTPTAAELARLFDLLVAHFRYVVVDCSGRVDQTAQVAMRPFECGAAGGPGGCGFAVERQPHTCVSGRGRHPRSGPDHSQSLQKDSRLHR